MAHVTASARATMAPPGRGGKDWGATGATLVVAALVVCGLSYMYHAIFHGIGSLILVIFSGLVAFLALMFMIFSGAAAGSARQGAKPVAPRRRGGRWDFYANEMAMASRALIAFLKELNGSEECRTMLNRLPGIDEIKSYASTFVVNDRLAMIAYCDARDAFRRLGHSVRHLGNLEGVGYCAFVLQLINNEFDPDGLRDPNMASAAARIVERLDEEPVEMNIVGRESEFRFAVIFGDQFHKDEWVQRYSTLMYRWASLIVKADGTVSDAESKTLEAMMKMGSGKAFAGNVSISGDGKGLKDSAASQWVSVGRTAAPVSRTLAAAQGDGLKAVMRKLDMLIGLGSVKSEVRQLANFIDIQRKRKEHGLKVAPISYHCVFTGNPGTGKTTVARILAEIYREMGIVKKGHLVETDRSGLVAEYVGQTAVKTNKIIDEALDGVLFIDEAYSLVQGGESDYGREAVATLLKRMEDDRDRLVVILAGYTEEMRGFIDSNPGLQSRFNRYIEFPDYSAAELAEIFLQRAERSQYTCDKDVRASIVDVMDAAVRSKDRNFGNARYVRNLFEKAIQRQAVRLSKVAPLSTEMLAELKLHDLGFAYDDGEVTA